MTAETLKPFITPTSDVNNFPAKHSGVTHSKRKIKHLIPTILSIIAAALVIGILSLTIWQTLHVQKLESDLNGLKRDMESLRERLGINYLEDLAEFQKDYQNMLIPDHSQENESEVDNDDDDEYEDVDDDDDVDMTVVDDDNDDYADENYHQENDETKWEDYVDMVKKEKIDNQSNETESSASTSSSASNDDNVFEDFTTYSDSKKKKQRKSRSIADLRTELQSNDVAQNHMQAKTEQHSLESGATTESQVSHHHSRKSHSRSRSRQSRRRLLVRKGESPVSAKSADFNVDNVRSAGNSGTPAAHFHLYGTVSHTHHGDMYVGHATASMNNQWQQHFSVDNGILTVRRSGLYYVYAQICYNDNHDQNGFIIFHGDNPFLQCLNTVPTNMTNKLHTCHTSGLIHLHENESIHLRDIHQDRKVVLRNSSNRSYFGIIKI